MRCHFEIENPTPDDVTFNWGLGVPSWAYWNWIVNGTNIAPGFSYSENTTIRVGYWGPDPFSMIWYAELRDQETGEILDNCCAVSAYSPGEVGQEVEIEISGALDW